MALKNFTFGSDANPINITVTPGTTSTAHPLGEGGGIKGPFVELTKNEYDALPQIEKNRDDKIYFIKDLSEEEQYTILGGFPSYGHNSDGEWWKFPNGIMIEIKHLTVSLTHTSAWGSWYESPSFDWGAWPQPFIEAPTLIGVTNHSGMVAVLGKISGTTATNVGNSWSYRAVSTAANNYYFSVTAIGKWKEYDGMDLNTVAGIFKNTNYLVANNLTTTGTGSVLDARQGKILNDKIDNASQWVNIWDSLTKSSGTVVNNWSYSAVLKNTQLKLCLVYINIAVNTQINANSMFLVGLPKPSSIIPSSHPVFSMVGYNGIGYRMIINQNSNGQYGVCPDTNQNLPASMWYNGFVMYPYED